MQLVVDQCHLYHMTVDVQLISRFCMASTVNHGWEHAYLATCYDTVCVCVCGGGRYTCLLNLHFCPLS
jgi:hypothetical protein